MSCSTLLWNSQAFGWNVPLDTLFVNLVENGVHRKDTGGFFLFFTHALGDKRPTNPDLVRENIHTSALSSAPVDYLNTLRYFPTVYTVKPFGILLFLLDLYDGGGGGGGGGGGETVNYKLTRRLLNCGEKKLTIASCCASQHELNERAGISSCFYAPRDIWKLNSNYGLITFSIGQSVFVEFHLIPDAITFTPRWFPSIEGKFELFPGDLADIWCDWGSVVSRSVVQPVGWRFNPCRSWCVLEQGT